MGIEIRETLHIFLLYTNLHTESVLVGYAYYVAAFVKINAGANSIIPVEY